jgi:hypothetical protein
MESTNKQQLFEFVRLNEIHIKGIKQSGYTWGQLADMFKLCQQCNAKQKSDHVRKIVNTHFRNSKIAQEEIPSGEVYTMDFSNFESQVNPAEIVNQHDGTYLLLPCVHAPFVNKALWISMLKLLEDLQDVLAGVIIMGDFLDLNTLSSHDKGRLPIPGINLGWEYSQSNTYLDSLDKYFFGLHKVYIWGNHEDRYKRYMLSPDSAKLKGAVLSPTQALRLKERGYLVLEDWKNDEYELGDLTIYHGDGCSKHVCHREMSIHKKSVAFCHTHRIQSYIEGKCVAYNLGTMSDFKRAPVFGYASKAMKSTWGTGFGLAHLHNGVTSVDQIVWRNDDHFAYAGKIYHAGSN